MSSPKSQPVRPFLALTRGVAAVSLVAFLAATALAGGAVDEALAAFKAGEFEKAVTVASKVAASDAAYLKARYVIGEAELARGRADEAAAAFQIVLDAKKDNVPALTGLGRAQAAKGDREAAKKTLKRASELDPKDAAPRRALGETLLADPDTPGSVDAAVKELEAASKLDPKDPRTARSLVEALLRKGSTDATSKAAGAFATVAPESAMAWFLKALVLDRKGEAKDAIAAYEKALVLDDRFIDAHRNLAVLCTTSNAEYADGDLAETAYVHATKYIELGGTDERLRELVTQIKAFLDEARGDAGK